MPARSQAQYRFLKAVANGSVKKAGLTPSQADEYTKKIKADSLMGIFLASVE